MKRTAKAELRAKPADELAKQADELRAQLLKDRIAGAVEGKPQAGRKRDNRRQIARLMTIISEQKRAEKKKVKA
jgi:ribosomal protein L29